MLYFKTRICNGRLVVVFTRFVLQTEISGKYIAFFISVSILISQSSRRKNQFTVVYFNSEKSIAKKLFLETNADVNRSNFRCSTCEIQGKDLGFL